MSLQLPPSSFKGLKALVIKYNSIPESDPVQRLFYLQKINYELNRMSSDRELLDCIYLEGANGWHAHLLAYVINPDASILLKGFQFAQAVAQHNPPLSKASPYKNEYDLMQHRDSFLKSSSYEECKEQYVINCLVLNEILSTKDAHLANLAQRQTKILELSKAKFAAIRQHQPGLSQSASKPHYKTKELSTQGNNFNFKFTMDGWEHPFVFRVEDREELSLDQDLYAYPVSRYFIEDFGVFMWGFENKESNEIEYKPVFLCQFAKQGNLKEVAQSLRGTNTKHYAGFIGHYFTQLTDLCKGLIDAGVYHPDIKLTNFLVHGNRLLISDRKTLINTPDAKVNKLRSTLAYAPQEYVSCVTPRLTFNFKAARTNINLPQFMAYQLGMALKEFIILTQREAIDPYEFRDHDHPAASYFNHPEKAIINLSTLIQELTREDATKRMSIAQMQELLKYRNHPPHVFNKEVERVLPASILGIQDDVAKINNIINSKLKGPALINEANVIFKKLSESKTKEPRLSRLAEQLAEKCFKEGSFIYFSKISKAIETALLKEDWGKASWYRKMFHILSFGFYRIPRYNSVNSIKIDLNFNSEEFQMHFCQLEYTHQSVIKRLGATQAANFSMFIYANLDHILPKSESTDTLDQLGDSAHQVEKTIAFEDTVKIVETLEADSGTVKINDTDINDIDSGTVQINSSLGTVKYTDVGSKVKTIQEESETDLTSDDHAIKGKSEEHDSVDGDSVSIAKHLMFFAQKKEHPKGKFGTFRTTMFRGDTSLKISNEPPAAKLESIFVVQP